MLKEPPIQQGKIYWALEGLFNCFVIKHTSNIWSTKEKLPPEAYAALARHFESGKSEFICPPGAVSGSPVSLFPALPSSESGFNFVERHRQVELNLHLVCHWWILWYAQEMGGWGNAGRTLVRCVCECMYTYICTLLYELNSHQKTVSNLWHGFMGQGSQQSLSTLRGSSIHDLPPVLMWKGPMNQKRPRHSRQILANTRAIREQIVTFKAEKGLRCLKFRTKKQCNTVKEF